MKYLQITFFIILSFDCYSQTKREYFFNDDLSINDSTSIILLIDHPQTDFARNLNHRIYTDTAFISILKKSWYIEYDSNSVRSYHRCGFDMYFYILSGSEFRYLKRLNSNCPEFDIRKSSLNILAASGKQLHIDTIDKIRFNTDKKTIFNEDLIVFFPRGQIKSWEYTWTKKYPEIYYENYFKTNILLDPTLTINQNAEKFIRTFTDNLNGINWNISKTDKTKDFEKNGNSCEVEITIYLKKEKSELFKDFTLENIEFTIPRGSSLILLYKD